MKPITVSFESDDPDRIALIVAAWELISSDPDREVSWVLMENFLHFRDFFLTQAPAVHEFAMTWNRAVAEQIKKAIPDAYGHYCDDSSDGAKVEGAA